MYILHQVRSCGYQFLMHQMFPSIKNDYFSVPKKKQESLVSVGQGLGTSKGHSKVMLSDAFIYDNILCCLHHLLPSEVVRFCNHISYFRKSHQRGLLLLIGSQLRDCIPDPSPTNTIQDIGRIDLSHVLDITPKIFRIIVFSVPSPTTFSPVISLAKCKFFWCMVIHHSSWNVWYRFLLDKLSCRFCLNEILPANFPYPKCRLCQNTSNIAAHFIFLCP
ncbi:hypothetical protein J3Q64DRAFT_1825120 [Phycomyces blakesleeanus]|uniref:Reverse transcriptase zinc-binding domain-containing protein n=1 Tax=Phycomyces blakesleeanus TaxID=4837 RepID=A0ABR3ALU5_PHYBL